MKIVKASAEILMATPDLEQLIERSGRVCYKSEDKITPESAEGFISRLMDSKHESVLEHGAITVKFICDRGVSHELVRHRIASFSQESTRYVGYHKDKFDSQITVIDPRTAFGWGEGDEDWEDWKASCEEAERRYMRMTSRKTPPQEARSVLPNSLKTEVVMTANPREWRHVFKLRCAPTAHPQMREVMQPLAAEFAAQWPSIFGVP